MKPNEAFGSDNNDTGAKQNLATVSQIDSSTILDSIHQKLVKPSTDIPGFPSIASLFPDGEKKLTNADVKDKIELKPFDFRRKSLEEMKDVPLKTPEALGEFIAEHSYGSRPKLFFDKIHESFNKELEKTEGKPADERTKAIEKFVDKVNETLLSHNHSYRLSVGAIDQKEPGKLPVTLSNYRTDVLVNGKLLNTIIEKYEYDLSKKK